MSRRQTSARLIACANEAKASADALAAIHRGLHAVIQDWEAMPDLDRKAALSALLLDNMPTSILNALTELAHFRLDGRRITAERVRRQAKAGATREIDSSAPDIHPFPLAEPPSADDLIGSPEEKEAYKNWQRGLPTHVHEINEEEPPE